MSADKYCLDATHRSAYHCARCHDTQCSTCDLPSLVEEVKTIVRYCPDWRCQREKKIEETNVRSVASSVAKDVRGFVRDRFTPGSLSSLDELSEMVHDRVAAAVSFK